MVQRYRAVVPLRLLHPAFRLPAARTLARVVAIGVCGAIAVLACLLVSLKGYSVDSPKPPTRPAEVSHAQAVQPRTNLPAATIPRKLSADIVVRQKENMEQVETYELTVGVGDPLLAFARGTVGATDMINRQVLGRQSSDPDDVLTFDQQPGSDVATIRIRSRVMPQIQDGVAVIIAPFKDDRSTLEDSIVSQARVTIAVENLVISKVRGPVPAAQSQTMVTFDGPLRPIEVKANRVTGDGARLEHLDPQPSVVVGDRSKPSEVDTSWIYWPLVMIAPWFLVFWAGRRAGGRLGRVLRTGAIATVLCVVVVGGMVILPVERQGADPAALLAFALVAVAIPFALTGWIRHHNGDRDIWPRWYTVGLLAIGAGALSALFALPAMRSHVKGTEILHLSWTARPWLIAAMATASAVSLGVAARLATRRNDLVPATAVAGFTTCIGVLGPMLLSAEEIPPNAPVIAVAQGLLWAPVALAGISLLPLRTTTARRACQTVAVVLSGLLFFPVAMLFADPRLLGVVQRIVTARYTSQNGLVLANVALAAGIVVILIRTGLSHPVTRLATMALVVIAVALGGSGITDLLVVATTMIAFAWLLPPDRQARAARLSRVALKVHKRLVRAEAWRRLTVHAGKVHFRAARQSIAETPRDRAHLVADLVAAQRQLDEAIRLPAITKPATIHLPEAALGSAAGRPAQSNAFSATVIGLALTLPLAVYEIYGLVSTSILSMYGTTFDFLWSLLPVFRWGVYAFVFGYLYSWLRGSTPVNKALALLGAVGIIELIRLFTTLEKVSLGEFATAGGIRLGQATVFCLGLGLFWEWRVVRSGGLPWARIRDFRTLRAFGTPLTAVAVAGLTAVATALASAAVMALLTPQPQPQQDTLEPRPPASPTAPPPARS
jgi:hypothetical protein